MVDREQGGSCSCYCLPARSILQTIRLVVRDGGGACASLIDAVIVVVVVVVVVAVFVFVG